MTYSSYIQELAQFQSRSIPSSFKNSFKVFVTNLPRFFLIKAGEGFLLYILHSFQFHQKSDHFADRLKFQTKPSSILLHLVFKPSSSRLIFSSFQVPTQLLVSSIQVEFRCSSVPSQFQPRFARFIIPS